MWEFLIVLDRNTLRKITVLLCAITTYNVLGKQGKFTFPFLCTFPQAACLPFLADH
jgi:hypothetical protein